VEAFLAGDTLVHREFEGWILAVIRHRTWRLGDQVDDLLQEIRLKLVRLFEGNAFRYESSLKTYVQAVSKHSCLDAVRRARIRETVPLSPEHPLPSSDNPIRSLERKESARICYEVLANLPETCRMIFRLALVDGLTYEEIAERLDVAMGTVKSRLARCRDRAVALRQTLFGDAS